MKKALQTWGNRAGHKKKNLAGGKKGKGTNPTKEERTVRSGHQAHTCDGRQENQE